MKTLVNNLAFRHAYQGFFLLLMIAIPNITLGMTTLYNNQTGLTFTSLESWGIIAVNLIIFYITYLWAKNEGLITHFRLDRKDTKAIIWGFVLIFLMGLLLAGQRLPPPGLTVLNDRVRARFALIKLL